MLDYLQNLISDRENMQTTYIPMLKDGMLTLEHVAGGYEFSRLPGIRHNFVNAFLWLPVIAGGPVCGLTKHFAKGRAWDSPPAA